MNFKQIELVFQDILLWIKKQIVYINASNKLESIKSLTYNH